MTQNIGNKKFVFICVGCKKGKCFPRECAEETWQHIKGYKQKEGYKKTVIREVACMGKCESPGPNLLVIANGEATEYSLGAKNPQEAKEAIDRFMDEHVIDSAPPVNV